MSKENVFEKIINDNEGLAFADYVGRTEFELYQDFRKRGIGMFMGYSQALSEQEQHSLDNKIDDLFLPLIDREIVSNAYLDNLKMSLIAIHSMDTFSESIEIIDKYIRPDPRTNTLKNASKVLSGFICYVLYREYGASLRQTSYLVEQLFKTSNSTVKRTYNKFEESPAQGEEKDLLYSLAFLLINNIGVSKEELRPMKKHKRSEKEFFNTIEGYNKLKSNLVKDNFSFFKQEVQNNPMLIRMIDFHDFDEDRIKQEPTEEEVSLIIGYKLLSNFLPNLTKSEEFFDKIEKKVSN